MQITVSYRAVARLLDETPMMTFSTVDDNPSLLVKLSGDRPATEKIKNAHPRLFGDR
jgi:hypothetical protein